MDKELAYAVRTLRKTPGFAAAAILTLSLGIGANTAIFSVMDAVLFRPLPYPAPERLVRVWQNQPKMGAGRLGTAPPEFVSYRDRTRAFAMLAGYQRASFDLTGEGEPDQISACRVAASLFPALGISPLMGRTFNAQEELPGAVKVVVLSHRFWKRRYAADPNVLGSIIRLNEQPHQIIGVMPAGFSFPSTDATPGEPPAVWVPLSFTSKQLLDWASSFDTSIIARLRDGISVANAREDVRRVAAEFQKEHSNIYSGNIVLDATVENWRPEVGERVPTVLMMLGGAVAFVLLIACANVANLLLARAGARQRELSIRRALGASAARLMRQIIAEAAILAIAGSVLGCAFAYGLIRVIHTLWISEINLGMAGIDTRVLCFTLGLSGFTCLACGLAPAWNARRPDVNEALKQSARQSGANRGRRRITRLLVVAEVASSVVLLIGSGLLLRSFIHVLRAPLGFDPEHALIVRTTFNRQRYASAERRHAAERAIVARLSALPGATAVALTTHVPLADERQIGFVIDGRPPDEFHWANNALVSGEYFRVMGIPLLSGRTFSDADTPESPIAAVINQRMAIDYWPNQDPLGKRFRWGGRNLTVVGVVGDIRVQGLDEPIGPTVYNSVYQVESGATTSGVFVIRTQDRLDPMRLAAVAKSAIWEVDHGLPMLEFSTLERVVSASLAARRASLVLIACFGLLALVLSLIGVYGVLSHAMTQRTREMGLRMALGARPIEIASLVIAEAVKLTTWGIVLGLVGGAIGASLISKLLFGVGVLDPMSYAGGVVLILAVSVLASYLPARRASRVDPMVALRYE